MSQVERDWLLQRKVSDNKQSVARLHVLISYQESQVLLMLIRSHPSNKTVVVLLGYKRVRTWTKDISLKMNILIIARIEFELA